MPYQPVGGGGGPLTPRGRHHRPVDTSGAQVLVPRLKTLPTLPDWWGKQPGNVTSYGEIRFPLSAAIAPDALLPLCYGAVRIGGTELKFGSVAGEELFHGRGVIAWCEGEIEAVDAFLIDGGTAPPSYADAWVNRTITHYRGATGDPQWSSAGQIFFGKDVTGFVDAAYTFIDIRTLVSTPLAGGWMGFLPQQQGNRYEWAADVRGLKIYDPRGPTTAYSTNPVLIARDAIKRARGLVDADFDDTNIGDMADASDTAGFSCSIAFAAKAPLRDALANILQTCNGRVIESNGKIGFSLEVEDASAAVAILTEADGDIWGLKYEWLSAHDRITRLAVSFFNKDANYKQDQTPDFDDPGIALGTVPIRPLVVNAPGINTLDAAVILRDYLFNRQAVTFRASGKMSTKGITLSEGQKVTLSTLKSVYADFILEQLSGDDQGFFSFVAKPYDAAVFGTTPISQGPPIFNPPPNAFVPIPAAVRFMDRFDGQAGSASRGGVGYFNGIFWDAPRIYDTQVQYGASNWATTGATGVTLSLINNGSTAASAATIPNNTLCEFILDLGVGNEEKFGRVLFTLDFALTPYSDFYFPATKAYAGDPDSLNHGANGNLSGVDLKSRPYLVSVVGGLYTYAQDFLVLLVPGGGNPPTPWPAQQTWQIDVYQNTLGGSGHLYEIQFQTYVEYDPLKYLYEIREWPVGEPVGLSGAVIAFVQAAVFTDEETWTGCYPLWTEVGPPPFLNGRTGPYPINQLVGEAWNGGRASSRVQIRTIVPGTSFASHYVGCEMTFDFPAAALGNLPVSSGTGDPEALPVGADGEVLTADSGAPLGVSWAPGGSTSPLTTKGDLFGFDTADARIPVGANGLALVADSAQALGVKWDAVGGGSPLTTKGDIYGFSTVNARVPVGANDFALIADSTEALGLEWRDLSLTYVRVQGNLGLMLAIARGWAVP